MNELDTTLPEPVSGEYQLGEMIGLRKAFGSVAGRCSAAAAATIKRMRDDKLYKSRTETWEQFCPQHLGMSSVHANRLIRYLDEFGPEYFHVSQLIRISPQEYRALRPAVKDGALMRHGEAIALIPENADRVAQAVEAWREEAKTSAAPRWRYPVESLPSLEKRGLKLAQEFAEMLHTGPSPEHRARMVAALERVRHALRRVA
jgi:hypothetical protein